MQRLAEIAARYGGEILGPTPNRLSVCRGIERSPCTEYGESASPVKSTTGRRPFPDLSSLPSSGMNRSPSSRAFLRRATEFSVNDYGVVTQSFWMVKRPFRTHSSPVSALVSSSGRREDAAYLIPSSIVRQFFNML